MRILYLAPHDIWPLTTGARLRDFYLARELARRASVTFFGIRHPGDPEPENPPASAGFERTLTVTKPASFTPGRILRGLIGPTPVTVLNFVSPAMTAEIRSVLSGARFDTVQVEGVHLAPYADLVRSIQGERPIISDWHNIESELMRRYGERASGLRGLAARRTASLLKRTEDRLLRQCDVCTVASDREREQLSRRNPTVELAFVPNGVDVDYYAEAEIASAYDNAGRPHDGQPRHVLFVGSMDYHANIDGVLWFTREVWPEVRRRYPGRRFIIVGRDPSPEVRALAAEDVEITGTVRDVRPFYANAVAVVAPLRVGGGTRLKILEAMAAGVPAISTRLGAEGLEVEDELDILFADDAEGTISAISRIIDRPEDGRRIAEAARRRVCAVYGWSAIGARLYDIHAKALEHRGAGRVTAL